MFVLECGFALGLDLENEGERQAGVSLYRAVNEAEVSHTGKRKQAG